MNDKKERGALAFAPRVLPDGRSFRRALAPSGGCASRAGVAPRRSDAPRRRAGARVLAALALAAACAMGAVLSACSQAQVDEMSPMVADVQLSSESNMTETSQSAKIKLVFDQPISVAGNVADDFRFLLNGSEPDSSTISVEVRASAEAVTFVIGPAPGVQGVGRGAYFALYQAGFSIAPARDDGALPSITGASGSCAVLDQAIEGTVPSGLAIEVTSQEAGSVASNAPARTAFRVTTPTLIRAITWFSPDGGQTKLLKHNHTFADADASACAADLAKVVNAASGLGIMASCKGDEVVLTATSVEDGQVIQPVVVEGVGVEGGYYDASQDAMGESAPASGSGS